MKDEGPSCWPKSPAVVGDCATRQEPGFGPRLHGDGRVVRQRVHRLLHQLGLRNLSCIKALSRERSIVSPPLKEKSHETK